MAGTPAHASTLVELAPNRSVLVGQQSDASNLVPYTESGTLAGPVTITSVTWWGYYFNTNLSSALDDFVINNINVSSTGLLTRSEDFVDDGNGTVLELYKYVLDLSDPATAQYFAGGSGMVSLSNNSIDVEWYWQGSGATDTDARAYAIDGTRSTQNVPEPGSLALMGLALAAMATLGAARARKLR